MAWTTSDVAGMTKYTQTLASEADDSITLNGYGALVISAADVVISVSADGSSYTDIITTVAGQEVCIPGGVKYLKVTDVADGGVITVYAGSARNLQDDLSIGNAGADPS